jgi:hypothetical protein
MTTRVKAISQKIKTLLIATIQVPRRHFQLTNRGCGSPAGALVQLILRRTRPNRSISKMLACANVRREISRVMNTTAVMLVTRFAKVLALAGFMAACTFCISAQTTKPATTLLELDKKPPEEDSPFNSLDEEMRSKRAVKFAQKEYQDNLDRARNLSFLGTTINASFREKHSLSDEDLKKLEKAEKLTKGIRNAAGGSEDEVKIDKPPKDLASALNMLEELTGSLNRKVEKTPKHVVSASVIDEANVLLELIRMVRTFSSKG